MLVKKKLDPRKRRHRSIRKRISGTAERPRLVVFRSARHIYAQIVDDTSSRVIAAVSDRGNKTEAKPFDGDKSARAKAVGLAVAKQCADKGITKVVFDRAGYLYHGRVAKVAEGAREGGLEF